MINERSIINFFIILTAAILGPYLVISFLENDITLPMTCISICAVGIIIFTLKDKMAFLPLFGTCIAGKFHFMPGGMGFMETFGIILILYYLIFYLALKKLPLHLGYLPFTFPIAVMGVIMLYHNHNFGLAALGNATMGSRHGLIILIIIITYFCGISIKSPSVLFLKNIPWYCCFIAIITTLPFVLSTYIPALTPFLYLFTDNVNIQAYVDDNSETSQTSDNGGRIGIFGSVGGYLQDYIITQYPIAKWLQPRRSWIGPLFLMSFFLATLSGYRNNVFSFLVLTLTAFWCYYSWRALLLPLFFVMGFYLTISINLSPQQGPVESQLPLLAQRSLSFMPADWSAEVKESAQSSNDFRNNIINVYCSEYLYNSPWIGNGYTIDPGELAKYTNNPDPYYIAKGFIISKAFHTGWISVYDCVGIIGSLSFVLLGLNLMWIVGSMIVKERYQRSEFFGLKVWLFCNVTASLISFFTVFGDFSSLFPTYCIYAIVVYHMIKVENSQLHWQISSSDLN